MPDCRHFMCVIATLVFVTILLSSISCFLQSSTLCLLALSGGFESFNLPIERVSVRMFMLHSTSRLLLLLHYVILLRHHFLQMAMEMEEKPKRTRIRGTCCLGLKNYSSFPHFSLPGSRMYLPTVVFFRSLICSNFAWFSQFRLCFSALIPFSSYAFACVTLLEWRQYHASIHVFISVPLASDIQ